MNEPDHKTNLNDYYTFWTDPVFKFNSLTVAVINIDLLLIGLNLLLLPEKLRFDEDYEWSRS